MIEPEPYRREIFALVKGKAFILQYSEQKALEHQLSNLYKWEREGKDCHVIEVRDVAKGSNYYGLLPA